MKYVVNLATDLEKLMVEKAENHLFNEVRIQEIYKNFDVHVGITHPFTLLFEKEIDGQTFPAGVFPSITLCDENDMKDSDANMPTLEEDSKVTSSEVVHIEENPELYIISQKDYRELKELSKTEGSAVKGSGISQRRKSNMIIEVWAENQIIKNRLYDIMRNWLIGYGRFYLLQNYEILIVEESISGQKGGQYNFDFGKPIYGGILRFDIVQVISQYVLDTDLIDISGIVHTTDNVNPED